MQLEAWFATANLLHGKWAAVLLSLTTGMVVAFIWRSRASRRMNAAIAMLTEGAGIPVYRFSLGQLSEHIARARRYERNLTLAVVQATGAPHHRDLNLRSFRINDPVQRSLIQFVMLGYVLRGALRETDCISAEPALERFILILPEVSKAQARKCLERLDLLSLRGTGQTLQFGLAELGSDGYIGRELLNAAIASMDESEPELKGEGEEQVSGVPARTTGKNSIFRQEIA